jgi:hypothetical protein
MSNYSINPAMIRVDFFKASGKWCRTEAVEWRGYSNCCIQDAFKESIRMHLGGRMGGMIAVCLDPYHEHAHPLMLVVGR